MMIMEKRWKGWLVALSSQHAHEHVAHETHDHPPHQQPHGNIEHLHAVASARTTHKVAAVIDIGELLTLGDGLAKEVAQGLPALLHLEFKQTTRVLAIVGGELDALGVVALVNVLALVGEVALEEGVKEHLEHGVVHLRSPGSRETKRQHLVAQGGELRVRGAPVDGGQGGLVPRVDIATGEDDLGFGVHLHEFLGKGTGGPVAHGLAVTEDLVPEFAGADRVGWQGGALGEVLGDEGVVPEEGVGRVLDRGAHHVVGLDVAKVLHGSAHGWDILLVRDHA